MNIQKLLMTLYYLKSLQCLALNLNLSKYIKDDCVLARKNQTAPSCLLMNHVNDAVGQRVH